MTGFSPTGPQFELDDPKTARPWFNLLSNGRLSLKISQTGEGHSFLADSSLAQPINLTRPPSEQVPTGRIIYLRDQDSGQFWSPTWQPVLRDSDNFQAVYSLGSLTIESDYQGIFCRSTFFISRDELAEIWRISLENRCARKRHLAVFIYLDWGLDPKTPGLVQVGAFGDPSNKRIFALVGDRREPGKVERVSFVDLNRPLTSFDCQSQAFFGPGRSLVSPQAVMEGKCSRTSLADQTGIAVMQVNLALAPRTETDFRVLIGHILPEAGRELTLATAGRVAGRISRSLNTNAQLDSARESVISFWRSIAGQAQIKTPDSIFDKMVNHWTKYQAWQEAGWFEAPVFGADDSLPEQQAQNLLALLPLERMIVKRGLEILLQDMDDSGRLLDHDRLGPSQWLVTACLEYLRESGHTAWLTETISNTRGRNVLNLLRRSIEEEYRLLESANWRAITPLLLYQNLRNFIPILTAINEPELAHKLERFRQRLSQIIQARLSKINRDLDWQSWLIISDLVSDQVGRKLLKAAARQRKVAKKFSLEDSIKIGRSVRSQAWLGLALAKLGEGDALYRHYLANLPNVQNARQSNQSEPFIYSRALTGSNHPTPGEGGDSWSSNAAGWWLTVALQGILGIQPQLGGLRLDPCLPRDWRRVEVFRHWRGADYYIRMENPFRREKGVDRIVVDGVRLTGQVIKPFAAGAHYVEVVLG